MNKLENEVSPEELTHFISKLTSVQPIEFNGFLKIFCVASSKEVNGKVKAREIDELLSEVIDRYIGLKRKQREEINQLLDGVIKSSQEKKIKIRRKKRR